MYLPDDLIVEEGDAGKMLYFIGSGTVKVTDSTRRRLYAILKARASARVLASEQTRGSAPRARRLCSRTPPCAR